jgi:transposase-like protein
MSKGRYPYEFKKKVVEAVEKTKNVAEVARAFKVSVGSVHNWVKEFKKNGEKKKDPIRRRTQFSDEVKRKAVELLNSGVPAIEVAEICGTTPRSVYEWDDAAHPEKRQARRVAGKEEIMQAEERLQQAEIDRQRIRVEAEQAEAERSKQAEEEKQRVQKIMADSLRWLQTGTKTKDSHWQEHGAESPYRPFPQWPYFRVLLEDFERERPYFVEKSRDMLISWFFVGIFTHKAMTTPGIEILFQSQKQEKANELIEYAKILYEQSDDAIKKAYPLMTGPQAASELTFGNGSRIIAIPGGGDQIRSYHPWGLLMDEAAFMPEGSEAFDNALSVCKKVVVISSAGPGWFADYVNDYQQSAVGK